MADWYPKNKEKLDEILNYCLNQETNKKIKLDKINGLIVPHAGYAYSGAVAGKAFYLLKNSKNKTAVILSPSHYIPMLGVMSHNKSTWMTPIGGIKIMKNDFIKTDISQEHAIDNEIPFLQKLGFKEILPLLVGELTSKDTSNLAKQLLPYLDNSTLIVSSDLSHFLQYEEAVKKDRETIKAIENLNSKELLKIGNSACGIYPLLILAELCKLKSWHPKLIEYKNSGDITGDKGGVVGYASFIF